MYMKQLNLQLFEYLPWGGGGGGGGGGGQAFCKIGLITFFLNLNLQNRMGINWVHSLFINLPVRFIYGPI